MAPRSTTLRPREEAAPPPPPWAATTRHPARRSAKRLLLGLCALLPAAAGEECSAEFKLPGEAPPLQPSDYNGYALPEVCLIDDDEHHVYLIGDWGGVLFDERFPPVPADKRSKMFIFHRPYVWGVDDRAQLLVAEQMRRRAMIAPPDFILNAGDNFYWGGLDGHCGEAPFVDRHTGQWHRVFESVYWGSGIDGKPWFGVFGNHDYGGYQFQAAWENVIGYSWGGSHSTNRWRTPAQYYSQKINYKTFSVELFMVDSNVHETWSPDVNQAHNLCGLQHNGPNASCGTSGPHSVETCVDWFKSLWEAQMPWLEDRLERSTATWQVLVSHYPPQWGQGDWKCLADRHGIDLFVSGHMHFQRMHGPDDEGNLLPGTTVVITGGGGGITSETMPNLYGNDDTYGFMDLTLGPSELRVEAISHGGVLRKTARQGQRSPEGTGKCIRWDLATHFEPVDGGADRGCRGANATDDAGTNFELLERVPTADACMRACQRTPQCVGIEHGQQVCELWMVPISATVPLPGFACLRLAKGARQEPEVQLSPPTSVVGRAGRDFECRAREGESRAEDYDVLHAPSVEGCEKLCLERSGGCQGAQYGPGSLCTLWRVPVVATAGRAGVVCIPAHLEGAGDATLAELGGLLHV